MGRVPGEAYEECRVRGRPRKPGRILMGGYYCLQFIGPINRQYMVGK
jgi:hypothetical protein